MRPIAQRAGLTPIQLACQWNLAHGPVACVAPTLIQEVGDGARPIEDKRAELAALPTGNRLSDADVAEIRRLGDNTGRMALKGASPRTRVMTSRPLGLDERLQVVAHRWRIDPERDLSWRCRVSAAGELPITGGCLCGAVPVRGLRAVRLVELLPLHTLQRRTGTAASVNARAKPGTFR